MPSRPSDQLPVALADRRLAKWRMPLVWGLVGVVVGAGGVGGAWAASSGGSSEVLFTLRGSLTLKNPVALDSNYTRCSGTSGYDDIVQGAAVTVYDAGGAVVGSGSLGAGKYATPGEDSSCVFRFAVTGVSSGSKFYQVEVSHRGKVNVTATEAKMGSFSASLGD